jgi:signal transduction histidine kinase
VEYLAQNGINCHVDEPENIPQIDLSGEFRRNIYLTAKEALHNIVKHAQASEVWIQIEIDRALTLKIKDNGIGIDNSTPNSFGNGLTNMKNRIEELRGRFEIKSKNGTAIIIKAPLSIVK